MKRAIYIVLVLSLWFFPVKTRPADIYGINTHVWGPSVLEKVKEANIGWIRVDADWNEIEKNKGIFDFGRLDDAINFAVKKKLKVLLILAYTPSWANGGKDKSFPPLDVSYWRRFVSKTVKRYKGKVHYWAIWNEPNLKDFFSGNPRDYLDKILIPAGQEIRAVDPDSKIVAPEISYSTSPESRWDTYMKTVLNKGKKFIDIVSIHIYDNRGADAIMKKIEEGDEVYPSVVNIKTITGYGDKELWLTETGWSTDVVSEDIQATNYLNLLKRVLNSTSVDKIFFYEIKDIENVSHYGILRSDNTPKKAYYTYKNFIANESDFIENNDDENERKKACAYNSFLYYNKDLLENLRKEKKKLLFSKGNTLKENVDFYYELSREYNSFFNKNPDLKKEFSKLLLLWGKTYLSSGKGVYKEENRKLFRRTLVFLNKVKVRISDPEKKKEISRGISLLEIYSTSSPEKIFYDLKTNLNLMDIIKNRK